MRSPTALRQVLPLFAFLLAPVAAVAQQTGTISGRVVDQSGLALPGVTVEARSEVLPGPRTTVSAGNGDYRLAALPPGAYTVTFSLSGMQGVTRRAQVQLAQDTPVNVTMGVAGVEETVEVTAEAGLVDQESTALATGFTGQEIQSLPVGQDYRDLQKLIPGVQYSQETVRGPSAGGSGQDNVYQFDGVNVTLPLFGTLSSEPASHDIAQFTVVRGGARAVDFDRAGGFLMDSVSKSGTSEYHGMASYQIQSSGMSADLDSGVLSRFEQDRSFLTANFGGPIVKDRAFFYASYYRPERSRENSANLYGELPDYESTRNEGFGKLTITPTTSVLLNLSYRDSKREDLSETFAANEAGTTGSGSDARLRIAIAEGSWVTSPRSFATFTLTHFRNETGGSPDFISSARVSTTPGARLDLANLDEQGRLSVPALVAGQDQYNNFVRPIIDRYGYVLNGVRTGGGSTGFGSQFDEIDFFRNAGELTWNVTLGSSVVHELHFGYQRYTDVEELTRTSNGWGIISVPGGRVSFQGRPIFYQADFQQQTTGEVPTIRSEMRAQNIEVNDTIRWNDWAFNVGVLLSNDTFFGQGLREDAGTLSGYTLAPGNKYEMYDVPFSKMIQPRIGTTWSYNGKDTVYASYARYNPAASSLPRAASWDRNLARTIRAYFDENGVLFATDPVASSSGKLFVEDMTPRRIDEFMIGTARNLTDRLSARLYGRHRRGSHYWEDTNNDARVAFNPPPGIPRELYIPDLDARREQIGSGSSYVIAELDGAFTRYWEATAEAEWRGTKTFVRGSYTWSHYYGNFDQDNTTVGNDDNIFIGSSFIADAAGRQLWDNKEGELRGDRPHLLKLSGFHEFGWNGSLGVFGVFQSGQPWEAWSFEPYRSLTSSTSDTNRYAEPAGSRRSDSHWQVDVNYTQNIQLQERVRLQLVLDVFNLFNEQTGYNIEPRRSNSLFGIARSFYDPRRAQVAARVLF